MALQALFRLGAVPSSATAGFRSLFAFWTGGGGAVDDGTAARRRGGAFYPTPEEIEEFLRSERKLERLKKQQDAERVAELSELYDEIKDPTLRERKLLLAQEIDDEEALLMIFLQLSEDEIE